MDERLAFWRRAEAATLKDGCVAMTLDQATELLRHALIVALLVSAPILIVGLIVSLVVSLFQAMTHVQEQTISLIPKIVAMVLAAVLLAPWFTQHLIEYARDLFSGGLH